MQKTARYLLAFITAAFVALTLVKAFYLTSTYGGVDLRCRVVNARLLSTSYSPYFYKWQPADEERYLDPNDTITLRTNGNVVTPAVLATMYPLVQLPYRQVRFWWTVLQILASAGIVFLLFHKKNNPHSWLWALPTLLGFICSDLWLYNIERGQMYIFYAFLFTLMYCVYISRWKYNQLASGFIGGLFVLFRPFAIVMGIGFLLQGKLKWVAGAAMGLLLGILVFVLPFQKAWQDYFSAMQEYIKQTTGTAEVFTNIPSPAKPAVVEGMDNLRHGRSFPVRGLRTFYTFLKLNGITITPQQCVLVFTALIVALAAFFFRIRHKTGNDPVPLFLFAFLLFLLSELFTPARRGGYNMIMWMVPVTLIYQRAKNNYPVLIIFFAGLLLLHTYPFFFPEQGELAELVFMLLTGLALFFPNILNTKPDGIS